MLPLPPAQSVTLGSILDELTGPFPSEPYGKILAQPRLRCCLLTRVLGRLRQTYPWSDELAGKFDLFPDAYRAQLWRVHLESAMYWILEEMVKQHLDQPHLDPPSLN